MTSLPHPGHIARVVASMAAKNKQRKKTKSGFKERNKYEEKDSGEEEEAVPGKGGDENAEELSLDEVLHLGGTRVRTLILTGKLDLK